MDGAHRMSPPGRASKNAGWRFVWSDVGPEPAARLRRMAELYERPGPAPLDLP